MILLDTHAFVWLVEGSSKLGAKARRRVEHAVSRGGVQVSAVSFWEIAMLLDRGRLRMAREPSEVRSLALRNGLLEAPVDGEIAIVAARLHGLQGDPADRMILATALVGGATLVTADEALLGIKTGPARIDARV